MRLVVLVLLSGCWSTPQPTGPAALLRRHHAPGDVLRICVRGDGRVIVEGYPPATMTVGQIQDERLLAVQSRRLELRRDTQNVSLHITSPADKPASIDSGRIDGTAFTIDDRNRLLDLGFHETPVDEDSDSDSVTLTFTPNVNDYIHFTYPEHAIRKNETFPLRHRETVRRNGQLPTQLAVDLTFTVREVTPEYVELTCAGTSIESARRNNEIAKLEQAIRCRARIDRRDGRTARWWIDTKGDLQFPKRPPTRAETHFDVAIGQASDAADICARAALPDST